MKSPRILFEIQDDLSTSAIAVGDVSGSGRPELCTGGRDGILRLYDANQQEVRLLAQLDLPGSILSLRIADANNDGQMEIVVGRSIAPGDTPGKTGTLQVYRYNPSGRLDLLAEHPIDRFVTSVYVTDVTGDGKNKIIAGGSDSTFRILNLTTDNQLEEIVAYKLDDMPITIGTCDVIGDEIEEIIIGNRDRTLRVFKLRDHSVEQIEVLQLPSPVISLAAGDLLGDRKMELGVVTHDGSIRIYRNEESKLELFTTLEHVKALSIRIAELNADHMDEIVVATSDYKIVFYSLYMAELQEMASVDIGRKILSIAVADAGGDDRREVLVGVSDEPLKVIEGLYQVIPKFEVDLEGSTGGQMTGLLTVMNITDQPIQGISGKLYWFPKDHMEVTPQQIRLDLDPKETKRVEVQLHPRAEGSVIIRPIVLMWTDLEGKVKQVTTPEVAILVKGGTATAAPASAPPVQLRESHSAKEIIFEEPGFASVTGTGFGPVTAAQKAEAEDEAPVVSEASLKAAESLLDKLFGEESPETPDKALLDDIRKMVTEPEAATGAEAVEERPVIPSGVESSIVSEIRSRTPKPPRPGTNPDAYSYLFKTMVIGEGAVGM
ncbi:MAG: WD40 repeat domain-containing protein, partial [Candidatus Thorarchaeota archaeon]|nr:WD40 repeat domain-containing protein [Candidatus Thorarchaeota archaeon]